jgi:hypothetical protein
MKPNKTLLKLALTGLMAGATITACEDKATSSSVISDQISSLENLSSASEVTPESALRQFEEDCKTEGLTFSQKSCKGMNECAGTTLGTGATETAKHSCKGNSSCAGVICQ